MRVVAAFLVAAAAAGAGPRTSQVFETLPALPRNPYWFRIAAATSGTNNADLVWETDYADVLRYSAGLVPEAYDLSLQPVRGPAQAASWSLEEGAAASVSAFGRVRGGGEAETVLAFCDSGGLRRSVQLEFTAYEDGYDLHPDALLRHMAEQVEALTNTYGYADADRFVYTTNDTGATVTWYHPSAQSGGSESLRYVNAYPELAALSPSTGTHTFSLNPDRITRDIDFSCLALWSSNYRNTAIMTLVTDQHAVGAAHWPTLPGNEVVFMDQEGNHHTRTLQAWTDIIGDLRLYRLDSPLPPSVTPAQVFPPDVRDYISPTSDNPATWTSAATYHYGLYGGMVYLDQQRVAHVVRSGSIPFSTISSATDTGVYWDSSLPVFTIVNGRPVLQFCFYSPTSGPGITQYQANVEAAIAAWGDPQVLGHPDLSGFAKASE